MLSANVYTIGEDGRESYSAITRGIDLVGQYIGESISSKLLNARLPTTSAGTVDPNKVGYGKLPRDIDLHIFAVPLERADNTLGVAYSDSGVAYIDTTKSESIIEVVTGHEVAHTLGFVLKTAQHQDQESYMHCCDGGCIMHKSLSSDGERVFSSRWRDLNRPLVNPQAPNSDSVTREMFGLPQTDFCQPCRKDLGDHGIRKVEMMRRIRRITGKIMPQSSTVVTIN